MSTLLFSFCEHIFSYSKIHDKISHNEEFVKGKLLLKNLLGPRMKQLRKQAGYTQLALAAKLNISNTTLSQYESGVRVPSDEIKMEIARLFDVTIDYLLGSSDTPNPQILHIPENLKDVQVAFHREEFEDLTQGEVDALAVIARTLKELRDYNMAKRL